MESSEELTISTIEALYIPGAEDDSRSAKVNFLVRNLCNSQPFLVIERDACLYFEDYEKTMMEAERTLAQYFKRLAEILEGRVLIREERENP